MSRKTRKRFGNSKRAAKVEKENSCSPSTTDFFTCLFKRKTCNLCSKSFLNDFIFLQGFSRRKVKFQFKKILVPGVPDTHRSQKVKNSDS